MRTKTEFRAIREITGITQSALAKELGVEVRSVKRWESDAAPQQPPADAWAVLDDALAVQRQVVDFALAKIDELDAPAVRLPYWSSAEEYAAKSTDAALGVPMDAESYRHANANLRAIASILMAEGTRIIWTTNPLGTEDEPRRAVTSRPEPPDS